MTAPRVVQEELLDGLPQDSPAAIGSRADLRIINRVLRSRAWFQKTMQAQCKAGESVLEVGAGTGELGMALQPLVPTLAGLDLCRRPEDWAQSSPWFQTDILKFDAWAEFPVVLGNLFFHHFDGEQLGRIGAQINRHARVLIASEPLRGRSIERWFSLLCIMIHSHPVTRHDGRVSIAAGFRQDELPRLLRLDPACWHWRVSEGWPGVYRLVAHRRP